MTGGAPTDLVTAMVERAALDGSTCLPATVVAAALRAVDGERSGGQLPSRDAPLVVHPSWGLLEEQIVAAVVELVARHGSTAVTLVEAPRGSILPDLPDGARVIADAHSLGLAEATELLARAVADDVAGLVLAGDSCLPYAPGPGRVFADLVASGALPVHVAPRADDGQLAAVVEALRDGRLPVLDQEQRAVVVTPVDDAGGAVRRAVQLVTSSVPSVLGIAAADTLIVAPRFDGAAGVAALRTAVEAAGATDIRTASTSEPAEALVLVLAAESAGSITRSLLVGAATHATRHLSVVHQAGPALADAVARRPHRPRHTRLATLLAAALG